VSSLTIPAEGVMNRTAYHSILAGTDQQAVRRWESRPPDRMGRGYPAGSDSRPAGRHRERPRPAEVPERDAGPVSPPVSGAAGEPRWPQRQPGTHLPAEVYAGRHRAAVPPNYQQLARLLAALRRM
jgi:hypothetical protein